MQQQMSQFSLLFPGFKCPFVCFICCFQDNVAGTDPGRCTQWKMIASIYIANEERSWENKQQGKDVCAALWGMMGWIGAKQKGRASSCLLLCYIWSPRTWLVWESSALCCGFACAPAERRLFSVWSPGWRWDETINHWIVVPLLLSPDRVQLIPTPVDRRIQTCQQRRTARRIGVKPSARRSCSSTGRRYGRGYINRFIEFGFKVCCCCCCFILFSISALISLWAGRPHLLFSGQ